MIFKGIDGNVHDSDAPDYEEKRVHLGLPYVPSSTKAVAEVDTITENNF